MVFPIRSNSLKILWYSFIVNTLNLSPKGQNSTHWKDEKVRPSRNKVYRKGEGEKLREDVKGTICDTKWEQPKEKDERRSLDLFSDG